MFSATTKKLTILTTFLTLILSLQPASAQSATVDLNSASAVELAEMLDGVGEVRAQAIVAWREANGGFMQVDQLAEVDGIGSAILEMNRDRLHASAN